MLMRFKMLKLIYLIKFDLRNNFIYDLFLTNMSTFSARRRTLVFRGKRRTPGALTVFKIGNLALL